MNPMRYTPNAHRSRESGYIAITTAIIFSLLVLFVTFSVGMSGLYTRLNKLEAYNKRISYFTARSCLEFAQLSLKQNWSYAGNETKTISGRACTILATEVSGANKVVKAKATVSGDTTNLKLIVTPSLGIVSLEELNAL